MSNINIYDYESINTMRWIAFPYSLRMLKNGTWQILNRNYSIIGHGGKYNRTDSPETSHKLQRLTKYQRAKLSWDGIGDKDEIFLYQDGCLPDQSPEHFEAYCKRLAVLMRLKVVPRK